MGNVLIPVTTDEKRSRGVRLGGFELDMIVISTVKPSVGLGYIVMLRSLGPPKDHQDTWLQCKYKESFIWSRAQAAILSDAASGEERPALV